MVLRACVCERRQTDDIKPFAGVVATKKTPSGTVLHLWPLLQISIVIELVDKVVTNFTA